MSNLLTMVDRYKRFSSSKRLDEAKTLYNQLLFSKKVDEAHALALSLAVASINLNEDTDTNKDNLLLESTTGTTSDIMKRVTDAFLFVGLKPEVNDLIISATTEASSLIHQLIKVIDPNKYELKIQVLTLEGREADRILIRGERSKEVSLRMLAQHTGTPYLYSVSIELTPAQAFDL